MNVEEISRRRLKNVNACTSTTNLAANTKLCYRVQDLRNLIERWAIGTITYGNHVGFNI